MGVGGFVSWKGESPKNLPIGEIYPILTLDGRRGDGSVSYEVRMGRDVIRSEVI